MKKIVLGILCCLMFGLQIDTVLANEDEKIIIDYETIEEGEYTIEIETYEIEIVQTRSSSIKKGGRDYHYKDKNGKIVWTATLTGTFEYNGTTSKCISASVSVSNVSSGWQLFTKKASTSGNQAKASIIMRETSTMALHPVNFTLSCSSTGSLY